MRTFLISAFALLGSLGLSAQEHWTLEKCIAHAQENNLTVQQRILQAQYSENSLEQSRQSLLPSVSANAGYSFQVGRVVNAFTNTFSTEANHSLNFSLGAQVVLFDGFRNINTIKQNKLEMQADQYAIERIKRDVSLEVALAYLLVLRNDELRAAAAAQLNTTRTQVERTSKLVAAGSLPQGSLLEIQAQEAQEMASVVEAENQYMLAVLGLTQLLELPTTEGFVVEKINVENVEAQGVSFSVDEVFTNVGKLPEMQEANMRLQSAEQSLAIARGNYSPELSASAGIYTGYTSQRQHAVGEPTFVNQPVGIVESSGEMVVAPYPTYQFETIPLGEQWRDNLGQQIGLSLRIPIYSQGRIRQQTSNAQISILNAKNNLEITKRQAYKAIQQAHTDALAALSRFQSSKFSVEAMQKAFEYTEQKYNLGAVNTLEYNQAKNNLFRAQSDLARSKYDYLFRLRILDFYRGETIR